MIHTYAILEFTVICILLTVCYFTDNLTMNITRIKHIAYLLCSLTIILLVYQLYSIMTSDIHNQRAVKFVTSMIHKQDTVANTNQLRRSKAQQDSLRNIGSDSTDMWLYIQSVLANIRKTVKGNVRAVRMIDKSVDDLRGYHSALVNDRLELEASENTEAWRLSESRALARLVGERIHRLQHPVDCSKVKYLVCDLGWYHSGIGYVVHRAAYCLINAFRMGRTFIYETNGWVYSKSKNVTLVFKPLTKCVRPPGESTTMWRNHTDETRFVSIGRENKIQPIPPHLPPDVPADIAERLSRFHANPSQWWVSQFVHYVWKLQPGVQEHIDRGMRALGFSRPIVGVHWRSKEYFQGRYLHPLESYMRHVKDYYDVIGQRSNVTSRRVFLSTEVPLNEVKRAIRRFPEYEFIINEKGIKQSEVITSRYTEAGLTAIMLDVSMLAKCDLVVCALTSNVCQLAAELKQLTQADPTTSVISLDIPHRLITQKRDMYRAWIPHVPANQDELALEVGDVINRDPIEVPFAVPNNVYHGNGYSLGVLDNGKRGYYPTYKARRVVTVSDTLNINRVK